MNMVIFMLVIYIYINMCVCVCIMHMHQCFVIWLMRVIRYGLGKKYNIVVT